MRKPLFRFDPVERQAVTVFLMALILMCLGLAVLYLSRSFTSDDVVVQTVAHQHISLDGSGTAWLGEDNYLIKVPLYLLADAVLHNSRSTLFITSLILNVIGFALTAYSYLFFIKRFNISEFVQKLSIIWLFSLSSVLGYWFLVNPNLRNIEVGISLFALTWFAKYMDGKLSFKGWMGKLYIVTAVSSLGLFLYSDPFFLAMLIAPMLIYCCVFMYLRQSTKRVWRLAVFLVASCCAMFLMHRFATILDIYNRHLELHFIKFDQLGLTLGRALEGLTIIFGADIWGKSILSVGATRNVVNFGILATLFVSPFLLLRKVNWGEQDPWLIFWVLQPGFILCVFITSNNTALNGYNSIRFLAMLPFYAPIIISLTHKKLGHTQWGQLLTNFLMVAILFNGLFMFKQLVSSPEKKPNTDNFTVINLLQTRNVTKGYAHYWNGHINSYLSNNTVTFIPVNCLQIQHFLMNDKTLALAPSKSFYLYDSQYPTQCHENILYESLGMPTEVISITDSQKLFIYNYDIKSRLTDGYFY